MLSWRTINIFISSTFLDLQVERDYISRFLAPRLNEALRPRYIRVNFIDLRSGVNTKDCNESEKEEHVLEVCIQEIHNSKPYFIGIIGGRYGWIPGNDLMMRAEKYFSEEEREQLSDIFIGKSVTELEMLVGMLRDKQLLKHSFVCIKSNSSFQGIPEELLDSYVDTDDARKDLLKNLRDRIIEQYKESGISDTHIIDYSGVFEGDTFTSLPGFVDQLANALLDDIISEDKTTLRPENVFEEERYLKEAMISNLSQRFCGRQELLNSELSFLTSSSSLVKASSDYRGHCVIGFSGCGKSSLFSKLCESLAEIDNPKRIVLSHAAGVSLRSINFNHMIDGWNYRLSCLLDLSYEDSYRPIELFVVLCKRVSILGYHIVIVIDSLDSFIPETLPVSFDFIPLGVRFVCTSLPENVGKLFKDTTRYKIIDIGCFSEEDADSLITKKLGYRDIPEVKLLKTIKRADNTPAYVSPLWLSMAVTRILELDARDYAIINKDDSRSIAGIVCSLPPEADEMFNVLLQRSYAYFDKDVVSPALSIMACSHNGVTEAELGAILGDDWDILSFARARQYLHEYISVNELDKRMSFSHDVLRKVILRGDAEKAGELHEKYLMFLLSQIKEKDYSRVRDYQSEAIYQIMQLNDTGFLTHLYKAYPDLGDSLYAVYCESPKRIIALLQNYIESVGLLAVPLVTDFIKVADNRIRSANEPSVVHKEQILSLNTFLISHVLRCLKSGMTPMTELDPWFEFFDFFEFPISYYIETNDTRSLRMLIDRMKETFELLKKNDGDAFEEGNYDSFYSRWCSTFHYYPRTNAFYDENRYQDYKEEVTSFVISLSGFLVQKSQTINARMDAFSLFGTMESELHLGEGHLYRGDDAFTFYNIAQEKLLIVLKSFSKHHLENSYYYEQLYSLGKKMVKQYIKRLSEKKDQLPSQFEYNELMAYLHMLPPIHY